MGCSYGTRYDGQDANFNMSLLPHLEKSSSYALYLIFSLAVIKVKFLSNQPFFPLSTTNSTNYKFNYKSSSEFGRLFIL